MMRGKKTNMLTLRIADEDLAQLEDLCERMPIVPRARLAREALRLGVELIAADPTRLLQQPMAPAADCPDCCPPTSGRGRP